MRNFFLLLLLLGTYWLPAQELSVFEVFTDHAVLQRNVAHPIWGWDQRNRRITVSLDGQEVQTKTSRGGTWQTELPATEAGGPHTIRISDGRQTITLEDVYFGDVYLLSGQSNMEWRLAQSDPDSVRAREIADPLIRQVLVAKTSADAPVDHIKLDETWKPGTASEIADFSGVGAYFAHYVRAAGVTVPIGLVHSSWGGSRLEPWLSAEVLDPEARSAQGDSETRAEQTQQKVLAFYREEFKGEEPPTEDRGQELGYLDDEVDVSTWSTMQLPGAWEGQGYLSVDGYFYYRKEFELTEQQAAGAATLFLGPIDDGDQTYINGKPVGDTPNAYSESREYAVPTGVLRPGKNALAIRVYDSGGGGGFMGSPDGMFLRTSAGEVPLAGEYYYRIGEFRSGTQAGDNQVPTILYNAMIAPLQAWPLTGVLWYQGESNAGPGDAEAYAERMRTLVKFWRDRFENQNLPFYWVQLANFQPPPTYPDNPGWAVLRASQTAALDLPLTGQAVITDIGEAGDIHPKNKWEVGRRLSLHALRDIYGQAVQASSPVATGMKVDGSHAQISFTELGGGLTVHLPEGERYPIVKSLSVQDTEGNWHWGVGLLNEDGDELEVINPGGGEIQTVRYAWFNNPDDANLFSTDGLPVTPFEISVD